MSHRKLRIDLNQPNKISPHACSVQRPAPRRGVCRFGQTPPWPMGRSPALSRDGPTPHILRRDQPPTSQLRSWSRIPGLGDVNAPASGARTLRDRPEAKD